MPRKKANKIIVEPTDEVVGVVQKIEKNAFTSRTHTSTSLVVRLDIFSIRNDAADLGILTNLQQLGNHLTDLLKAESVRLVEVSNAVAQKYSQFTPGIAISRAAFDTEQVPCPERDYQIIHGMATNQPQENSIPN